MRKLIILVFLLILAAYNRPISPTITPIPSTRGGKMRKYWTGPESHKKSGSYIKITLFLLFLLLFSACERPISPTITPISTEIAQNPSPTGPDPNHTVTPIPTTTEQATAAPSATQSPQPKPTATPKTPSPTPINPVFQTATVQATVIAGVPTPTQCPGYALRLYQVRQDVQNQTAYIDVYQMDTIDADKLFTDILIVEFMWASDQTRRNEVDRFTWAKVQIETLEGVKEGWVILDTYFLPTEIVLDPCYPIPSPTVESFNVLGWKPKQNTNVRPLCSTGQAAVTMIRVSDGLTVITETKPTVGESSFIWWHVLGTIDTQGNYDTTLNGTCIASGTVTGSVFLELKQ